MLTPLPGVKIKFFYFGENRIQWVPYFVKTEPNGYHKTMIPAQHWFTPNGDLNQTTFMQ
jgi:hypothetical protein